MQTQTTQRAPRIIRAKDRDEWLKLREAGIGSSEVATLLGVNPYETPYQLWLRKTGQLPPKEETQAMRMGHLLEPVVAELFHRETGLEVLRESEGDILYIDPVDDFLRASPDRIYLQADGRPAILECKSTRLPVERTDVPRAWYVQLQYQMMVSGIHAGSLAWLVNGREFDYCTYGYSEVMEDMMRHFVGRFYRDNVLGRQEPELTTAGDAVLKHIRHTEGKTLVADARLLNTWHELRDLREQIKRLEEQADAKADAIKLALGDAEALTSGGETLVTWRAGRDRSTFDTKRFKAEHPDLAQAYTRHTPAPRTFLVK